MAGTHPETIDWTDFWRAASDEDRESASPSAAVLTDVLTDFFAERGVPDTLADVGCGAGATSFFVAENYDTEVVGYDAAEPVLAENRERARDEDVENLTFERGVLLLGYTNHFGKSHYENVVPNPPDPEDAGRKIDPDRFAERFSLVLSGESTLSCRQIQDALDTWPRSLWKVVDKPEKRWMWRNHPVVWVPT